MTRAVWTELPRRPEDVNSMAGIRAFMSRWDAPAGAGPRSHVTLMTNAFGNIGPTMTPAAYSAPDLCPSDPQWNEAIEAGVRPLVDTLVTGARAITYTSCEGHRYPGLDIPPACLDVGLLPRDHGELLALAEMLGEAVTRTRQTPDWPEGIEAVLWRNRLHCETTAETFEVLDLSLECSPPEDWDNYFTYRSSALALLRALIEDTVTWHQY